MKIGNSWNYLGLTAFHRHNMLNGVEQGQLSRMDGSCLSHLHVRRNERVFQRCGAAEEGLFFKENQVLEGLANVHTLLVKYRVLLSNTLSLSLCTTYTL